MKWIFFGIVVFLSLDGPCSLAASRLMWTSRYVRSMAGRTLLSHLAEAQNNRTNEIDLTEWYYDDIQSFPKELLEKFIQSDLDEDTKDFLQNSCDKSDAVFTQFGHMLFRGLTSLFMSVTTINGILQRGSMFVYSSAQFKKLLNISNSNKKKKLLDLGAGDGKVTAVMEPFFKEVYTTEQSPSMRWRLHWRGYKVLELDKWQDTEEPYDVISCLNLLDRCDKPLTLLKQVRKAIKPDTGRVVVAVVLLFHPCVESGRSLIPPTELINLPGETWKDQTLNLIDSVFLPSGFLVEHFTKLPYLCEGDLYENFYVLSDAVFVLKPV